MTVPCVVGMNLLGERDQGVFKTRHGKMPPFICDILGAASGKPKLHMTNDKFACV